MEPVVTYEVWVQDRGEDPARRHHETGYSNPRMAEKIADQYNEDQVYLDRYEPDENVPTRRFFVVKATTTFEEV